MSERPISAAQTTPAVRDLYPHLDERQLLEVEQRLTAYVSIVLRIMEYLKSDPAAYARYQALQKQEIDLGSDPGEPTPSA